MSFQFEHSNSTWVLYSEYEWKQAENGKLYLTACSNAQPTIYDPLKEYQQLVLDALYIGRLGMKQEQDDEEIQAEIKAFAEKYGLFGLMTALPTTPSFMDYEAVYLPKNRFIKKETMSTEDYLNLFFPFDKLDVVKRSVESLWNIEGDNMMMALAMTMSDRPMAVNMSFQRQYAESYEWMKQVFTDWAFNVTTVFLYYNDYDKLDEDYKQLMRQSIRAFDGNAPSYHIELLEQPTLVCDFHSLLLGIQLMLSFMLTDEHNPMRVCKKCSKFFVASRPSAVFCSPRCKNQYNVYKNRAKNKTTDEDETN
ncbi:MAG: hypothetical protein IJH40_08000 [Ruminococcus sp.]|uniref:hypothetical protein n=1 Tax=Ruminococcus sp. TaxID=41978 RepID=UPI002873156F|nr:hypothetical protein [Ruminococcus sp.]MBQ3285567.1 hypothetical protein [Ruminococcus sp.]